MLLGLCCIPRCCPDASPAGGYHGFHLLWLDPQCRSLFSRFLLFPSLRACSVGFVTSSQLQRAVLSPQRAPRIRPNVRVQMMPRNLIRASTAELTSAAGGNWFYCPFTQFFFHPLGISFARGVSGHQLHPWCFWASASTWCPLVSPLSWGRSDLQELWVCVPMHAGNVRPSKVRSSSRRSCRSCWAVGRAGVSTRPGLGLGAVGSTGLCSLNFLGAPCPHHL